MIENIISENNIDHQYMGSEKYVTANYKLYYIINNGTSDLAVKYNDNSPSCCLSRFISDFINSDRSKRVYDLWLHDIKSWKNYTQECVK